MCHDLQLRSTSTRAEGWDADRLNQLQPTYMGAVRSECVQSVDGADASKLFTGGKKNNLQPPEYM